MTQISNWAYDSQGGSTYNHAVRFERSCRPNLWNISSRVSTFVLDPLFTMAGQLRTVLAQNFLVALRKLGVDIHFLIFFFTNMSPIWSFQTESDPVTRFVLQSCKSRSVGINEILVRGP